MKLIDGIKNLVTLAGAEKKQGRGVQDADLSLVKNGALLVNKGRIVWSGPQKKAHSKSFRKEYPFQQRISLGADTVLPGFVDCHTHMVFAGHRRDEFELRHRGYSYQEIAAQGGGILSTVRATRKASLQALLVLARERELEYLRQGVVTLEVKSGYGLNLKTELKMLRVANELKKLRVVPTFLGAHAVPPEFSNASDYIDEVISWLPKVKRLSQRLDVFLETGFFGQKEVARLFSAGKEMGFHLVAHADQLNSTGASVFAVNEGAQSVDHCLRLQDSELHQLARAESTCVLLPTSDLYLHLPYPPARRLIEAGARIALATDFNPGSAPSQDLSLTGVLARLEMKMTLPEVLCAFTLNGAYALGLEKQTGCLVPGRLADFVVLDEGFDSLFYQVGYHPVSQVWREGRPIFRKK